ncbi:MAG TPA: DNA repair protein RecO [Chloroflexota bacterium]
MDPRRVRVYRTEGIVLKRSDYGEADRLVTLFTPIHGKLRAIAKGVRRPTSRMSGSLELFCHSDFLLAVGRELDVVAQGESLHPFRRLREDFWLAGHAHWVAELADHMTVERNAPEARPLFDLLLETLHALDAGCPPEMVVRFFEVQLLRLLGYGLQLARCLHCDAVIVPGPNFFSRHLGGVLCPNCGPAEASASPIPVNVLKVLRYLQRTERASDVRLNVPRGVERLVEAITRTQVEQVAERRIRSSEFIELVRERV